MSIYVTSHAWQHSAASGSVLLVMLAICDFADDEGRAYPAVATLAHKARTSERTVQYALRRLIEIGELTVEHGRGLNGSNLYRVQVQNLRGANSAGVQSTTERGATGCTQTVIEPSKKKKENAGAKQSAIGFDSETGTFTGIAFEQLALWKRAHAGVDVDTEIVRAACWLIANPARRKSNNARFLANWLMRAGERVGHIRDASDPRARKPPATHRDRRDEWARGLVGDHADEGEAHVIDVDAHQV